MALPFHHPASTEPLALGAEKQARARQRQLSGDGDDTYFVGSDGTAYKAYSLAWRYLGLFIDCDGGNNNRRSRRHRLEDNDNACQRNLLWAAYHDPNYQGGAIGEYSFYDRTKGSYDAGTCQKRWMGPFAPRCQKLNCHESHTAFELVGVFKESDGLDEWSQQLFKHQGYCQWDGDKNDNDGDGGSGDNSNDGNGNNGYYSDYNFMSNLQEKWTEGCAQLENYVDEDGYALYIDTKPEVGGDMTYGVYSDASCSTLSSTLTWDDVLAEAGDQNDNDGDYLSSASIERWNDLLGDYKICQPCRAYNRVKTGDGSGSNDNNNGNSNSGSQDDEEDDEEWGEDDGEGGNEPHGFDCYDAAGYQNCNQCYKFESQTDMELASTSDLALATSQGTILSVTVDGTTYGSGYYKSSSHTANVVKTTAAVLLSTAALAGVAIFFVQRERTRRRAGSNAAMKEGLTTGDGTTGWAPGDDDYDQDGAKNKGGTWLDTLYDSNPFWTNTDHDAQLQRHHNTRASGANSFDDSSSTTDADSYRDELLAQIQERDRKLERQAARLTQMQRQLDSYKSIVVVEGVTPGAAVEEGRGASSSSERQSAAPSSLLNKGDGGKSTTQELN